VALRIQAGTDGDVDLVEGALHLPSSAADLYKLLQDDTMRSAWCSQYHDSNEAFSDNDRKEYIGTLGQALDSASPTTPVGRVSVGEGVSPVVAEEDVPMTIHYGIASPTPEQSDVRAAASRRRERPTAPSSAAVSSTDDSTELVEGSDEDGPLPKRKSISQPQVFREASSPTTAS
jgi:hypothetical protein